MTRWAGRGAVAAVALALAAVAGPSLLARQDPGTPQGMERAGGQLGALLQRGRDALRIEEFHGAKEILERAVQLSPDNPEANYLLARAWAGLKQVKPAEVHYRKVLKVYPSHTGAIMGLAAIAEGTGDYDGAERFYREAIASGNSDRAPRALASLLARAGRGDEAMKILTDLLKADPEDLDTRFEMGLALALQGDCAAAVPHLRKVVAAQPRRMPAIYQLGNCLGRIGQPEEASEMLASFTEMRKEELEIQARDRLVHFTMLESDRLAAAGKMKEAVAKAHEAVAADPSSARAHAYLGSILVEVGDNAGALKELMEAARLDPGDAMALTEVGRLLVLSNRVPEGMEYLKRATEADKNLAAPHRFLAILYKQMGRNAEAERHRAAFLRLNSQP